jgi:pyrophosphatase PpaX
MIRAVLLDLDGTLVDTIDFILSSVRHTFEGDPRAPTDAEWIAGIGKPIRVQIREIVGEDEDEIERLVVRYRAHQRANFEARTRAYPGAVDAISALRAGGRRLAIVTGKLVEPARWSTRHVGLEPHLDLVVGADTCARCKPHPDPVLHALSALGAQPEEAIFVGDSPHDVNAGRAAGVVTVGALWGSPMREELLASRPDHLLERIQDLPALVSRLDARADTPAA